MSLVPSLLQAIVQLDGEALVMHAGDKPYVVSPTGQVDLATRGLTLDAVNGIVSQLLPTELQSVLEEFGAVQYELPASSEFADELFTVVAARGGEDVWVEVRRRRVPDEDRVPEEFFGPRDASVAAAPYPVYANAGSPELAASHEPMPDALDVESDSDIRSAATALPETADQLRRADIDELPDDDLRLPADHHLWATKVAEHEYAEAQIDVELDRVAPPPPPVAEPIVEVPEPTARAAEPIAEPVEPIVERIQPEPTPPPVIAPPVAAPEPAPIARVEPEPPPPPAPLPVAEPIVEVPEPTAQAAEPIGGRIRPQPTPPPVTAPPVAAPAPAPVARAEPEPPPPAPPPPAPPAAVAEPPRPSPIGRRSERPIEEERAAIEDRIADRAEPVNERPRPVAVPEPPPQAAPEPTQQAVILPLSRNPIRGDHQAPLAADPTMSGLDRLLRLAAARGASALYLSSDSRPSVRVDGELQLLEGEPELTARDVESLLLTLMPERSHEALRTGAATEWICEIEDVGRVRCMSFRDHRGPGGVFRLMPTRSVSADQLALPRAVQALAIEPEGLVLVAGPRSSGKRTLISAFVDLINRSRRDHVITIEREVNIVHERGSSFISQREVRGNDDDMLAAARAALREDPDVLVIEDLHTAGLMNVALEAASSGHLVIGGFSAHTATAAIDRIIDLYPPDARRQVQFALADTLRGVIVQVLLRKAGGGRAAARELLLTTPAVASVIAEGKTSQLPMAIEGGRRSGMVPLNDALVALVQQGIVDAREAYRYASDRPGLLAALKRQGVDTSFVERLA
jgi:twitching motility protein PilT